MNTRYRTPEQVRALLAELTGRPATGGVAVVPGTVAGSRHLETTMQKGPAAAALRIAQHRTTRGSAGPSTV